MTWLVLFKQRRSPLSLAFSYTRLILFPAESVQGFCPIAWRPFAVCLGTEVRLGFLEGWTDGKVAAFTAWHLRRQDSDSLPELYPYLVARSCVCQLTPGGWSLSSSCLEREVNIIQLRETPHFLCVSFPI